MYKRLVAIICFIGIMYSLAIAPTALASTAVSSELDRDSYIVDPTSTTAIYGLQSDEIPTTVCPIRNGERKAFKASATGGQMFTNCLYTGKTRYSITVHNEGSSNISVMVIKRGGDWIYDTTVPAGQIYGFSVGGLKTSDRIYIQFTPYAYVSYRFSGHIQ
ncbi:hypothetical protein [Bifidobacterium callitrichos]|uniref:hypothetical protein n=1 Tax=Bifidobacterium callitrichos TaxID=762209 RepID=UPI0011B23642|nr:hypothetical protein [Bifidobacterium callitrichos]